MFKFKTPMLLDGATGTNLFRAGMPSGICVEQWILEHPAEIIALQKGYAQAGSDAVTAPTFESNRHSLSRHGFGDKVLDFNRRLVALTRGAVSDFPSVAVAGNMSPTGVFVEPFGDMTFSELCEIYREQAFALKNAGVDYIACETFTSLTEARAALLAAKETELPVTVTLTVNDNGKTLSGGSVLACLVTLAAMGAAAVGLNCSTGPEIVLNALSDVSKHVSVPIIAKPNAGVPDAGVCDSSMSPKAFAAYVPKFLAAGVGILGGCCGTAPEHIAAMHKALGAASPLVPSGRGQLENCYKAASEKQPYFIPKESMEFSPEILCDSDLGDSLLDLDGENIAARVVIKCMDDAHELGMNAYLSNAPFALLGNDASSLGEALKLYQGRAMIDSRSQVSREELETLKNRYGAIII